MSAPLLAIEGLTKRFGGLAAVKDLTLHVERGSIASLIGPNGAGKSTVFNVITGIYAPTAGSITFDGRAARGTQAVSVAAAGVMRTVPEHPAVRVHVGARKCHGRAATRACTRPRSTVRCTRPEHSGEERAVAERARELLEFVGLGIVCERVGAQPPVRHAAAA